MKHCNKSQCKQKDSKKGTREMIINSTYYTLHVIAVF